MPMAAPATPAPTTRTLAGGTLPAAVTCPVKRLPNSWAASTTARYPPMFAIELSTSSDWAREMRGTASTASADALGGEPLDECGVEGRADQAARIAPGRRPTSSSVGALILSTMSAPQAAPGSATAAPACSKPHR